MIKITLLGSGNVAHQLLRAIALKKQIEVNQIYARNPKKLASWVDPNKICTNTDELVESDIYIICVSDIAIAELSNSIPFSNKLVLHTSGAVPISDLSKKNRNGVFYPLQTFTKDKNISFDEIPICIEAENNQDIKTLEFLAKCLSNNVYHINSQQRSVLHLAAVFVCNFVNHMYYIGSSLCENENIPFKILQPLIEETANKIKLLSPQKAQTGPAKRGDLTTINKHLNILNHQTYQDIYKIITESIKNVEKL